MPTIKTERMDPDVIYLQKRYDGVIEIGGIRYQYVSYVTTTFNTQLYKYKRL